MGYVFSFVFLSIMAFLLGSVPFGLLIARTFRGIDPRLDGSRNVGATNVARLCGVPWGVLTLACDLLKGYLPVLLYTHAEGGLASLAYPIGVAVICGHMFSIFLRFKGGKGVATTVGVFLALSPLSLILAGIACLLVIWRTGFVSAGSLTLVTLLPIILLVRGDLPGFLTALTVTALVVYAHRENIRRLRRGEEKPWVRKKTDSSGNAD